MTRPPYQSELTPELIGRFTFRRRLGAGAFATVWLAEDRTLGSAIAIKVLADNWAEDLHVRERFVEEARLTRRADSEWVVRIYDLGTLADGRPYTVMSLADRGTLADRLADGPLPLSEVVRIGVDLAAGITTLHEHGILHRDLKPSNILFQSVPGGGERTLIADLGLATRLDEASRFTLGSGTLGYAAPEQFASGGDLDVRADVFSLGAVVRAMVSGSVTGPPAESPGPQPLADVIARAVAPERTDRYSSAAEFAEALARTAPELPAKQFITGGPAAPAVRRHARLAKRWPRRIASGAVLIAVTGAAAAAMLGWRADEVVRVSSREAGIRLDVPRDWSGEIQKSHWLSPTSNSPSTGFATASNLVSWSDATSSTAGVFVAVGGPDDQGLISASTMHPDCRSSESIAWTGTGYDGGTVVRWSDCPGGGRFVEAVLERADSDQTVYVQVKNGSSTQVTRLLDSIRWL